jgi:CRISPR-associated endonuclease/helicase Cas3
VRDQAAELVEAFTRLTSADEREMIVESALWHDLGKAHETFKVCCGIASQDAPLAKTPDYNWRSKDERKRKYFRHELASALAYLANRQWDAEASLAAYLIAAHHGKVRMRFRALPKEQEPEDGRLFARGVWDDDELPQTDLGGVIVPATKLNLELMQLGKGLCGPSWSQRTQRLLKERGPFRLAWLEALLRIADWRASAAEEEAGHDGL